MPASATYCLECGEAVKAAGDPLGTPSTPDPGEVSATPVGSDSQGVVPEVAQAKRADGMAEVIFTSAGGTMLFGVSADPPLYGIWFKARAADAPITTWPLEDRLGAEQSWARRAPNAQPIEPPVQELWACPAGFTGTHSPTATATAPLAMVESAEAQRERLRQSAALDAVMVISGAVGLILTIWGFVVHSHNNSFSTICSTGLGQLGQDSDPQLASQCAHWALMSDLGLVMVLFGLIALGVAGRLIFGAVVVAQRPTRS